MYAHLLSSAFTCFIFLPSSAFILPSSSFPTICSFFIICRHLHFILPLLISYPSFAFIGLHCLHLPLSAFISFHLPSITFIRPSFAFISFHLPSSSFISHHLMLSAFICLHFTIRPLFTSSAFICLRLPSPAFILSASIYPIK